MCFNMTLPSVTSINNIYGQMLAGRFNTEALPDQEALVCTPLQYAVPPHAPSHNSDDRSDAEPGCVGATLASPSASRAL